MKKIFFLSVLTLFLLTGCSPLNVWVKSDVTTDQQTRDEWDCRQLTNKKMGYSSERMILFPSVWRYEFAACMEEKGYQLVKVYPLD